MLGQIDRVPVGIVQAVLCLSVGRPYFDIFRGAVFFANRHQRLDTVHLETEMVDALFEVVTLDFPLRANGDNGQIDMTVGQIGGRPLALDDLEAERISKI